VNYLLPGEREKELQGGVERGKSGGSQGAFALAQPVNKTRHPMRTIKILFPSDLQEMARCRVVTALRAAGFRSHLDGYSLFTLAPASVAQAAISAGDSSLSTISATIMSALCDE